MSDLLWAAWGINRPETGKRTAPSARNRQEIDVSMWRPRMPFIVYDAENHALITVMKEDIRAHTGKQEFVKTAPVNLIYVADFSKVSGESTQDKYFYAGADTGFISENVYLYCTSAGLATVVRGYVDKPALEKKMGLGPDKKVTLCQSVGYPPK
jgi:nitroreductase